jgi:radical SAM/Cys-rich protein
VLLMADPSFDRALANHGIPRLRRAAIRNLQINVGKQCNQTCRHCHVNAGPTRTESMTGETVDRLLTLLERTPTIGTVDITGGAPELNPYFRDIVTGARSMGRHVMDRCNLTVLQVPGQEDTANFLAGNRVEVVASLPCYGPENVDKQRGDGVFRDSLLGLRKLNALGYGHPESGLVLNLVYNPVGAFLPPDQVGLEGAYKQRLLDDFGIVFNRLYTITNMPIERFARDLEREGALAAYMELLVNSFNPSAVSGLMCIDLISIGWDGCIYDCDFNQMLDMPCRVRFATIWDIEDFDVFTDAPIATGRHCFGCTAGAGSSCGGALAAVERRADHR